MQTARSHSPSQSALAPTALPRTGRRTIARAGWRFLWAVPALGMLLVQPPSPATWPALLLLLAAVSVLHADSILRMLRPRLLADARSQQQDEPTLS